MPGLNLFIILGQAVVVAQLAKRSLPTPEVHDSNALINCIENTQIKKKEAGICQVVYLRKQRRPRR